MEKDTKELKERLEEIEKEIEKKREKILSPNKDTIEVFDETAKKYAKRLKIIDTSVLEAFWKTIQNAEEKIEISKMLAKMLIIIVLKTTGKERERWLECHTLLFTLNEAINEGEKEKIKNFVSFFEALIGYQCQYHSEIS